MGSCNKALFNCPVPRQSESRYRSNPQVGGHNDSSVNGANAHQVKEILMAKKPPRRDPIIVYKREEKGLKPFLRQSRGFRFGPLQAPPPKQRKPKEVKTVV